MKTFVVAAMLVLLPAVAFSATSMGVYFTYVPGQMHYYTMAPYEMFEGYIFVHNASCYLNAVEFMVELPSLVAPTGFTLPPGALSIGDPYSGMAVSFWPPLDGWTPGYNLICTLKLMALSTCMYGGGGGGGGALVDAPIRIVPSPSSGRIAGVCYPDNEMFDIVGFTSIICPFQFAVQERSWGAIKSLYR